MRSFSKPLLKAIRDGKALGLRAGIEPHRFIRVWVVVVRGRVFVRSWNDKPDGWYRAFLDEPQGAIEISAREIRVRARRTRGERLLDEIDLGYRAKYNTRGARKFVLGFVRPRRRATTIELLPR